MIIAILIRRPDPDSHWKVEFFGGKETKAMLLQRDDVLFPCPSQALRWAYGCTPRRDAVVLLQVCQQKEG